MGRPGHCKLCYGQLTGCGMNCNELYFKLENSWKIRKNGFFYLVVLDIEYVDMEKGDNSSFVVVIDFDKRLDDMMVADKILVKMSQDFIYLVWWCIRRIVRRIAIYLRS